MWVFGAAVYSWSLRLCSGRWETRLFMAVAAGESRIRNPLPPAPLLNRGFTRSVHGEQPRFNANASSYFGAYFAFAQFGIAFVVLGKRPSIGFAAVGRHTSSS